MVYLIKCDENNTCKIGYAKNPNKRLNQLNTASPFNLRLLYVIQGDRLLERHFQDHFNYLRLNREWFNFKDEIESKFKSFLDEGLGRTFQSEDKPMIMFNSLKDFFINSSDVKIKLIGYLQFKFSDGKEFTLNKLEKNLIAYESNCSPRSIDNSITFLVRERFLVRVGRARFIVNPRFVFKGSVLKRNELLKEIIKKYCEDC